MFWSQYLLWNFRFMIFLLMKLQSVQNKDLNILPADPIVRQKTHLSCIIKWFFLKKTQTNSISHWEEISYILSTYVKKCERTGIFFIQCIIKHNSQPPLEPIIDWDKWSYLKKKTLMKSLWCFWNSAVKINEKQFLDIHYFKLQISALLLFSRFIEFS